MLVTSMTSLLMRQWLLVSVLSIMPPTRMVPLVAMFECITFTRMGSVEGSAESVVDNLLVFRWTIMEDGQDVMELHYK